MAIRFDRAYNAEIARVVKNFNQKRNRAVKQGYKYLPPVTTVSELKSRYATKAELNRELNAMRRFSRGGNEVLKVIETTGGAKAIKWEYDYLKKNLKAAKAFYDREIADASRLDTEMLVNKAEIINNLKAKRDYLELEMSELNQSQFKTFRKTINGYLYANERNATAYRSWLKEVEIIMRNLGYDEGTINKFFEGFDQLTPREFITMYRQSALVSRIYELYIPTRDHSFRLSTTEEDAKDLINTFMAEKDELIKKAKFHEEMDDKPLEDFVKSLTEQELPKAREEGKAKLKRKNLTAKQIKQLEELGWDDLIDD